MGLQEGGGAAEDVAHPHPLAQGADRDLAGGEGGDQLEVGREAAADAVADLERVAPEAGQLAVELVEGEPGREHRVRDVEQLPVLGVDVFLDVVPEVSAGERGEHREAAVVGAGLVDPALELVEVGALPGGVDDEVRGVADAEVGEDLERALVVRRGVVLVHRGEPRVVDLLEAEEDRQLPALAPHRDQVGEAGDDVRARLERVVLADAGVDQRPRQVPAALDVHPEDVVGQEDVRRRDVRQLLDHPRRGFLAERRLVELPHRAEVALERAAARGLHQGERAAEVDVVLAGVVGDQVARRERQLVQLAARRRVPGVDHAVGAGEREAGHRRRVGAALVGVDQPGHDVLAVADHDGVDPGLAEPVGVARGVVAADHDLGVGELLAHPAQQAQRAVALGREVALEADHLGRERLGLGQARLEAVDPQVDDLALVARDLEPAGDALEPERLDERDHLEPEDAADRRFEERDPHGRTLPPPRRPRLGMTGLAAEDPNRGEILADRGDLDRWPPCSGAAAPGCRVPARGGAAAAENAAVDAQVITLLILLAAAVVLFATELVPIELTGILLLLGLHASGLLGPDELFTGFGDSVVVFLGSLFVVSAALTRSGALEPFEHRLARLAETRPRLALSSRGRQPPTCTTASTVC